MPATGDPVGIILQFTPDLLHEVKFRVQNSIYIISWIYHLKILVGLKLPNNCWLEFGSEQLLFTSNNCLKCYPPESLQKQCKNPLFEDVFSFNHDDFPLSCWFSGGTKNARCQLRELRTMRCSKVEMSMFWGIPKKYMWEHSRKTELLDFCWGIDTSTWKKPGFLEHIDVGHVSCIPIIQFLRF